MALAQRHASRFFAAFYSWERLTVASRQCRLVNYYIKRTSAVVARRSFVTTCSYRQDVALQPDESQSNPDIEDTPTHGAPIADLVENPSSRRLPKHLEIATMRGRVRRLMRDVPYSVAVVTAAAVDPESGEPVPLGSAVSSLNTVTLDPPTVSFNIKQPSRTLEAIEANDGHFNAHFMVANGRSARLVDSFAKGNREEEYAERPKLAPMDMKSGGKTAHRATRIKGNNVLGDLACIVTHQIVVADHVVVIARVLRAHVDATRQSSALLYVQGQYVENRFFKLLNHQPPSPDSQPPSPNSQQRSPIALFDITDHPLFSAPLDPDRESKLLYTRRLWQWITERPYLLQLPARDAEREVLSHLDIPADALGVCIEGMIESMALDKQFEETRERGEATLPVDLEFHGSLSLPDIAVIKERAIQLVKMDPRVVSLDHQTFLRLLGVSRSPYNLLIGDIVQALRDNGLASSHVPPTASKAFDVVTTFDLEQLETRLAEHFHQKSVEEMATKSSIFLAEAVGYPSWAVHWIDVVRHRIYMKAFPKVFSEDNVDIAGSLSQEDQRRVIDRILHHVWETDAPMEAPLKILQQCKIHPLVTNINLWFLMERLQVLSNKAETEGKTLRVFGKHRLFPNINDIFHTNIKLSELDDRVYKILKSGNSKSSPYDWSHLDWMAALGLRRKSTVTLGAGSYRLQGGGEKPLMKCLICDCTRRLLSTAGEGTTLRRHDYERMVRYLEENETQDLKDWLAAFKKGHPEHEKYNLDDPINGTTQPAINEKGIDDVEASPEEASPEDGLSTHGT